MKIPDFIKEIWSEAVEMKLLVPGFILIAAFGTLLFCLFHPHFKEINI